MWSVYLSIIIKTWDLKTVLIFVFEINLFSMHSFLFFIVLIRSCNATILLFIVVVFPPEVIFFSLSFCPYVLLSFCLVVFPKSCRRRSMCHSICACRHAHRWQFVLLFDPIEAVFCIARQRQFDREGHAKSHVWPQHKEPTGEVH